GRWLFSAATDPTIRAWPVASEGKRESESVPIVGHADEVVRLAITPGDRWLISADIAGRVLTWELAGLSAGELKPSQQLAPHEGEIWAVELDASGETLLTASADRNARLWTLDDAGLSNQTVVL